MTAGIIIAVVGGIVGFIFLLGSDFGSGTSYLDEAESKAESKDLRSLSKEELNLLVVDWEYKDILRNVSEYKGELITFRGDITKVETISENHYVLVVSADGDMFFVEWKSKDRLLVGDDIRVYGEVEKIIEVGSMLAPNPYPVVQPVHLICFGC